MHRTRVRPAGVMIALMLAMAMPEAHAARQGFYAGFNLARVEKDIEPEPFAAFVDSLYETLELTQVANTGTKFEKKDDTYAVVGGYRWLRGLAFEAEYLDLGTVKYRSWDVVNFAGDDFPVRAPVDSETSGLSVSALGILPLGNRFELYGRAGVLFSTSKLNYAVIDEELGGGVTASDSGSDIDFHFGAGATVSFYDVYTVRAEYRRVLDAGDEDFSGEGDVDMLTIGLIVSF